MSQPAAKQGDKVIAIDTHIVMIPSPGGPVPTPTPAPFSGELSDNLSADVLMDNKQAATEGSVAMNSPEHVPVGGPFQKPPSNKGTIKSGSGGVLINNKKAARTGDTATTCNDPADTAGGTVIGSGTVMIGD